MKVSLIWLAAVALAALGTALVFAGVTMRGLFTPGILLIDAALLAAAAAGVLSLRGRTAS